MKYHQKMCVKVTTHKCISIQEHTFGVLCKSPTVKLGECDAQVWTSQPEEMSPVPAVQHVRHYNLIKHVF